MLGAILSIVLTVLDDTPFSMYLPTHEQKAPWPSAAIAVLRSRTLKSDAFLVNDTVLPLMAMPQCRFFSSLSILPLPGWRSRRAPMESDGAWISSGRLVGASSQRQSGRCSSSINSIVSTLRFEP